MHGRRRAAGLDLLRECQSVVDRDREGVGRADGLEGKADGGGGVHADHPVGAVEQRTSGVARLERGVALDQAVELFRAVLLVGRGDRLAEADDRAADAGELPGPAGVARGGHLLADAQRRGVPERRRAQIRRAAQLEHRDIVGDVVAHDGRLVAAARRRDDDTDGGGTADHMVVRQHLAAGGQHDACARRRAALVAERRADVDDAGANGRDHVVAREGDAGRNRGDDAGKGTEDKRPSGETAENLHVSIDATAT